MDKRYGFRYEICGNCVLLCGCDDWTFAMRIAKMAFHDGCEDVRIMDYETMERFDIKLHKEG